MTISRPHKIVIGIDCRFSKNLSRKLYEQKFPIPLQSIIFNILKTKSKTFSNSLSK